MLRSLLHHSKNRLTRNELKLIFVACAFPIHIWAIVLGLREVPAWLLRLNPGELIGMFSYVLVFALVESALVFVITVVLVWFLPDRLLASGEAEPITNRVAAAASMITLAVVISLALHLFPMILDSVGFLFTLALLAPVGLGSAILWFRSRSRPGFLIRKGLSQLAMLTFTYLIFDLFGLIVVIFRNLT